MRRKPVPNPLSLADDSDSLGEQSAASASAISSANASANTSANNSARALPYPDPERLSPRPTLGSESTLQVISPTSSRSPKSPRSPFVSKFNTTTPRKPLPQQNLPYPVESHMPPHPPGDVHLAQHRRRQSPHRREPEYPPLALLPSSNTTNTITTTNTASTAPDTCSHPEVEKHSRSGSRFFNFGKASRSANQLYPNHNDSANMSETMSRGTENTIMSDRGVSSKNSKNSDLSSSVDLSTQKSGHSLPSRSDVSLTSASEQEANSKKNKPKPFTLMGRNRSLKDRDGHSPKESITIKLSEPERDNSLAGMQPLRTAPMNADGHERSFRHMMNSTVRNHSADRAIPPRDIPGNKDHRHDKDYYRSNTSSLSNNNNANTFFNGLKNSGSRAADMISKGLFGRSGRSASSADREPVVDDEHYVLKVINLPLVEQTRLTRISKRLEDSRDKTEFWMPAFPWRAIDYLNLKGTDVEGLYRVPGSGPQIKKWQRKFDEEYDVDLFAQDDLYDINIIGSMFKAWLRELPDELFPKEAQERISRECAGAESVPQMLIDELSNLSPFNYYLLFAITCHLSLLLAHSDKNKMDFRNLCICFQPCMKIDAFCFKFLVCDWRLCWQGCRNEARYIEEEYQLFQQPLPRGLTTSPDSRSRSGANTPDDRNLSSSDSNKLSAPPADQHNGKLRKKPGTGGQNGGATSNYPVIAHSLGLNGEQDVAPRRSGERELRPLSPIKPLSPMNFS
ncbi:uncharacterized protein F4807DRAFT_432737 [Annulohypoxylon truncatum]|uniref:uncharacterized protein n=1 Tax=Annulohypoxylon truncatum TaxID=327061 RepID=UPI002007BA29|nr:uncharacterized protein F4807DRAFT_432737 [Annulohypoxylon truncatum]KAI1208000.1 hypothetical protein F4807DRAFT_432737 [Annulohypoxylon truncatum]